MHMCKSIAFILNMQMFIHLFSHFILFSMTIQYHMITLYCSFYYKMKNNWINICTSQNKHIPLHSQFGNKIQIEFYN